MIKKITVRKDGYEVDSNSFIGQQLELFTSTKKINLTDLYMRIPKGLNTERSKQVVWESKNLAQPIKLPFLTYEKKPLIATIKPAYIEDTKNEGVFKSMFPGLREERVEGAITQLMTQNELQVDYDSKNISRTFITVTPYQIRKTIVDATNEREGKNLSVNDCAYSTNEILEALKILKGTEITVTSGSGKGEKKEYQFNRIQDLFLDGNKRQVIGINTMITASITNENYLPFDRTFIALSTEIQSSIVRYIHLNWRGLSRGQKMEIFAITFMEKIEYSIDSKKSTSKNIAMFLNILRSIKEIDLIEFDEERTIKSGRAIKNKLLVITMSEYFFNKVIELNKIQKRSKERKMTKNGLLIKPLKEEYRTDSEYQVAIKAYHTKL